MSLGTGIFYLATRDRTVKVYIQPFWLDDERAKKVALGELKVSELDAPENLTPFAIAVRKDIPSQQPIVDLQETSKRFNRELSEMSTDFFNKIGDIQEQLNKVYGELYALKTQPKPVVDEEVIIRKVLQKMPVQAPTPPHVASRSPPLDVEAVISQVLARLPDSGGKVYQVSPLEKIKKDFLKEIRDKILADVGTLREDEKKALKYIESKDNDISPSELITKCFLLKAGGAQSTKVSIILKSLLTIEAVEKTPGQRYRRGLMKRIDTLMGTHSATQEEKEQLYNHIMYEVIK